MIIRLQITPLIKYLKKGVKTIQLFSHLNKSLDDKYMTDVFEIKFKFYFNKIEMFC